MRVRKSRLKFLFTARCALSRFSFVNVNFLFRWRRFSSSPSWHILHWHWLLILSVYFPFWAFFPCISCVQEICVSSPYILCNSNPMFTPSFIVWSSRSYWLEIAIVPMVPSTDTGWWVWPVRMWSNDIESCNDQVFLCWENTQNEHDNKRAMSVASQSVEYTLLVDRLVSGKYWKTARGKTSSKE